MKKILLLSCLLLGVWSASALAAGLSFAWFECDGGVSGASQHNWNFACNVNSDVSTPQGGPPYYLVAAFDPPAQLTQFTASTTVVDILVQGATLPNWWFVGSSGCRSGQYGVIQPSSAALALDCVDPYAINNTYGPGPNYQTPRPGGAANTARMVTDLSAAISSTVNPGTVYYAQIITLTQQKSTGLGSCVGCTAPACLVLNQVELLQVHGAPGGDVNVVTNALVGRNNFITWQGGDANCPGETATKNATWGSIKALYR